MMSHRILPAALLLCTLAACGELPTQQGTQAQPAAPAYDSGYTMGSGNSATQSSGFGVGSGNEIDGGGFGVGSGNVAPEDGGVGFGSGNTPSMDTASGDSTGRGGYTMGSGN
jgi:hypothetical protein